MEYFEARILPTTCDFSLIWYRYVDDIIVLWSVNRDPLVFLNQLNQLVPSIKFKVEIENYILPFLDTLTINTHDQFKFNAYRKPTSVESFIHYFSNHDVSVKRSVFSSMFLRALKICDQNFHYDNEKKDKERRGAWKKNGEDDRKEKKRKEKKRKKKPSCYHTPLFVCTELPTAHFFLSLDVKACLHTQVSHLYTINGMTDKKTPFTSLFSGILLLRPKSQYHKELPPKERFRYIL